jgi:hypothetical protein
MQPLNWSRPPPALFSLTTSCNPGGHACRLCSSRYASFQVAIQSRRAAALTHDRAKAALAGRLAGTMVRHSAYHDTVRAGQAPLLAPPAREYHPPCGRLASSRTNPTFTLRSGIDRKACGVAAPQFRRTGLMHNAVRDVEYTGRERLEIAKDRSPYGRSATLVFSIRPGSSNAKRW